MERSRRKIWWNQLQWFHLTSRPGVMCLMVLLIWSLVALLAVPVQCQQSVSQAPCRRADAAAGAQTSHRDCRVLCSFPENSLSAELTLANDIGTLMGLNRTGRMYEYGLSDEANTNKIGLSVNNRTGEVAVNGAVDYDTLASKEAYATVAAKEIIITSRQAQPDNSSTKQSPSRNSTIFTCQLNVSVTNVNEAPTFQTRYSAQVAENSQLGTRVTQVSATEPDGDPVTYGIASRATYPNLVPGHLTNTQLGVFAFSIGPSSGEIRVRNGTVLDFERLRSYTMYVVALDSKGLLGAVRVDVEVTDANEFPPTVQVIDPFLFVIHAIYSITEGVYTPGLDLAFFQVHDPETNPIFNVSVAGANGRIQLAKFAGTTPPSGTAEIYRLYIVAGAMFDREAQSSLHLSITVSDNQFPTPLTGNTTYTLFINDVDDSSPLFTDLVYSKKVREDAIHQRDAALLQVHASDPDQNDTVVYSITMINNRSASVGGDSPFSLRATTGELFLRHTLDYESVTHYQLVVEAASSRNASRFHTALIDITVLDVNDNGPIFTSTSYVFEIRETSESFQTVGKVNATDADGGANGQITYMLLHTAAFYIEKESGKIISNGPLDREKNSQYDFTVVATDGGDPVRQSSASVTVIVLDINDNGPLFQTSASQLQDPILVSTSAQVGHVLLKLLVNDSDNPENARTVFELLPIQNSPGGNANATIHTYFALKPQAAGDSVDIITRESLQMLGNNTIFHMIVRALDRSTRVQDEVTVTIQTIAADSGRDTSSSFSLSTPVLVVIILAAILLLLTPIAYIIVRRNLRQKKEVLQVKAHIDHTPSLYKSRENVFANAGASDETSTPRPATLDIKKSMESITNADTQPTITTNLDVPNGDTVSEKIIRRTNGEAMSVGTPGSLREVSKSKGRSRSIIYSASPGNLDMELDTPASMDDIDGASANWQHQASVRTLETQLGSMTTTPSSELGPESRSGSAYFGAQAASDAAALRANLGRVQSQSEHSLSQSRPQSLIADYRRLKHHMPPRSSLQSSPRKATAPPSTGLNSLPHSPQKSDTSRSMYGSTPSSLSGQSTPTSLSGDELGTRTWSPHRRPINAKIDRHHSIGAHSPSSKGKVAVMRHVSFNSGRYPEMQV